MDALLHHRAGTAKAGAVPAEAPLTSRPSAEGLRRIRSRWGEPLFVADWTGALFLHFEVDPGRLQPWVPFALDHFGGRRAFVSLVAFTMRGMRPVRGGALAAWALRLLATHPFLNVRTYVVHRGEPGIHFLREWLPSRPACLLGPAVFGLPYRPGRLRYHHPPDGLGIAGEVEAEGAALVYRAAVADGDSFPPCLAGSLDEFLLERYTAFTARGARRGYFRVWHRPWPQARADARLIDASLLARAPGGGDWGSGAALAGAHFSPGAERVWMGRPGRTTEDT